MKKLTNIILAIILLLVLVITALDEGNSRRGGAIAVLSIALLVPPFFAVIMIFDAVKFHKQGKSWRESFDKAINEPPKLRKRRS